MNPPKPDYPASAYGTKTLRKWLHHTPTCAADSFDTGLCNCGLRDTMKAHRIIIEQAIRELKHEHSPTAYELTYLLESQ